MIDTIKDVWATHIEKHKDSRRALEFKDSLRDAAIKHAKAMVDIPEMGATMAWIMHFFKLRTDEVK